MASVVFCRLKYHVWYKRMGVNLDEEHKSHVYMEVLVHLLVGIQAYMVPREAGVSTVPR